KAVLEVERRDGLVVERRPHRGRLASQPREVDLVLQRVAAAMAVVGVVADAEGFDVAREVLAGAECFGNAYPLRERQEAGGLDAVVLHAAADGEEARRQRRARRHVEAALRILLARRRRADELLVDLRLVLLADDLVVRLVGKLVRVQARRAVVLPPQLAGDRRSVLVDDGARAVGAA